MVVEWLLRVVSRDLKDRGQDGENETLGRGEEMQDVSRIELKNLNCTYIVSRL